MKKKFLMLCVFSAVAMSGVSQTFKMLQSTIWYCVGNWQEGKHILMTTNQSSKYDSEVRFLPSGKLSRKAGSAIDSSYTYQYRKGIIKIDRSLSADNKTADQKTISFYKLNALEYGKTFELIPSTESEFNKPSEQ
jgi:hypothetical protein